MTLIKKIFIELSSCFKGGPAPEAEIDLDTGTKNDYCRTCDDLLDWQYKLWGR